MHFSTLFKYCPICGSSEFVSNNVKSKKCISCGFVFYINPSAAVAAFIVNANNELLVCKRGQEPKKGTLDLPGGFVDDNESAEHAIEREISEELNAKTTEIKYIFSLPNDYTYSGWTLPTLDMFFVCKIDNYINIKPSDDVEDYFYVSVNELNTDLFGLNSIKNAIRIFKDNYFIA